jgi:hypothetical protein
MLLCARSAAHGSFRQIGGPKVRSHLRQVSGSSRLSSLPWEARSCARGEPRCRVDGRTEPSGELPSCSPEELADHTWRVGVVIYEDDPYRKFADTPFTEAQSDAIR